jgi:hypothetical protein
VPERFVCRGAGRGIVSKMLVMRLVEFAAIPALVRCRTGLSMAPALRSYHYTVNNLTEKPDLSDIDCNVLQQGENGCARDHDVVRFQYIALQ